MLVRNKEKANLIQLVLLVLKEIGCDPGDIIDITKKITPEVRAAGELFFRLAQNGNLSQTQINLLISALKAAGFMDLDARFTGRLTESLRQGLKEFLAIR